MTTTSSLAFPTMEVPPIEDSMEMASPYQGQADDFDIDIDLMEDHVSNMDSDMMGADDFPNTSHPSLFPNDANDDADMADEPSEGSMVDVENYAQEDNDIDVQYEETTYEAEMLEGDQTEATEAAVPSIHIEVSPGMGDETNKPSQPAPEAAEPVQEGEGVADPSSVVPPPNATVKSLERTEQDTSLGLIGTEQGEIEVPKKADATADHEKIELGEKTNETTEENAPSTEEQPPLDSPVENAEALQAKPPSHETDNDNAEHAEAHTSHETEGQAIHDDESLHPVKVIYQDNEISLFPPVEGDSAETFFLHDEDVAYDNVGKLFSSLREVLMDNVADDEVLVIDIESLGIQITEDSSHTTKMTLHQILDIYLRLCHNDGTHEPEALYITLGSKPTVESELAGLDASAKDGKGLSQIHLWDDYGDAGLVAEETKNIQEDVETSEDHVYESHDVHPVTQSKKEQEQVPHEFDHDADDTSHAEDRLDHEDVSGSHDPDPPENATVESSHEEEDAGQEEQNLDQEGSLSHDGYQKERDDSEAPRTESSATVAPVSEPAGTKEPSVEATADGDDDEHTSDPSGEDEHEGEDEEYPEHDQADGPEVPEFHEAHPNEEGSLEETEDDAHPVDISSIHEQENPRDADAAARDEGALANTAPHDVDHASYEQSESTLDNAPREDPAFQARTPEPEDDLLGIAEDLMQTPAKDHQDDQLEYAEGDGAEQYPEDNFDVDDDPSGEADDGDFYPDFEVSEAIELGGADPSLTDSHNPDNPSTKRSREEEDDWEIADTTNPDTKRRRPS
ncbi:uncharacterized protein N7459_007519 [Penicillium hispanicum]|uniref:uncharacterized protein n=1 Tax=Penicillium hispanicum TaxID=1080232 RepID=UPI0025424EDB|nr:uncharacterized protein N7459_007519 [Penicillium hispanicum]KAJ5578555.1 hypothetical protein N7459_007519 [Penicillium hispanicum]